MLVCWSAVIFGLVSFFPTSIFCLWTQKCPLHPLNPIQSVSWDHKVLTNGTQNGPRRDWPRCRGDGGQWRNNLGSNFSPKCTPKLLYSILRNFEFWRLCLSCISYYRFLLSLDDPLPVLCANSTFQRQPNCLQVKPGKNSKLLFRTPHSTVHNFHLIQFLSDIYFAPNDFFYLFHLDSNDD